MTFLCYILLRTSPPSKLWMGTQLTGRTNLLRTSPPSNLWSGSQSSDRHANPLRTSPSPNLWKGTRSTNCRTNFFRRSPPPILWMGTQSTNHCTQKMCQTRRGDTLKESFKMLRRGSTLLVQIWRRYRKISSKNGFNQKKGGLKGFLGRRRTLVTNPRS